MKRKSELWILAVYVLATILCAIACTSCKTVKQVETSKESKDSVRVEYKYIRDSVNVVKHDSVYIKEKGDSVYIYKYETEVQYVYKNKTDTVGQYVDKESDHQSEKVVEVNKLTKGQKNMIAGFWVLLLLILLTIAGFVVYKIGIKKSWWSGLIAKIKR